MDASIDLQPVGTVGTGAPRPRGRCWRMVYEDQATARSRWRGSGGGSSSMAGRRCGRASDRGHAGGSAALIGKNFRWLDSNSPGYHAGERIADSVWQKPGRDFPSARFLRVQVVGENYPGGRGVKHRPRGTARSARWPGTLRSGGRCWRRVHENPVGRGWHCMEPVAWVGRWKFLDGWTKVWSSRTARRRTGQCANDTHVSSQLGNGDSRLVT